jgi:hypothetical protein
VDCQWGVSGAKANCSSGKSTCPICQNPEANVEAMVAEGGMPRIGLLKSVKRIVKEGPEARVEVMWLVLGPASSLIKQALTEKANTDDRKSEPSKETSKEAEKASTDDCKPKPKEEKKPRDGVVERCAAPAAKKAKTVEHDRKTEPNQKKEPNQETEKGAEKANTEEPKSCEAPQAQGTKRESEKKKVNNPETAELCKDAPWKREGRPKLAAQHQSSWNEGQGWSATWGAAQWRNSPWQHGWKQEKNSWEEKGKWSKDGEGSNKWKREERKPQAEEEPQGHADEPGGQHKPTGPQNGDVDHYNVLELKEDATQEAVTQAYRKFALKLHPDKGGATFLFQLVHNAFSVLSDTKKRAVYDAQRRAAKAPSFKELPSGWKPVWSKSKAAVYFFRDSDGHSQWKHPAAGTEKTDGCPCTACR